jgi:hypothetical protein
MSGYKRQGGVSFVGAHHSAKATIAAELYADFIERGIDPHNLAILSPHNKGDGGTPTINVAVRKALGLPEAEIVEGDLLIITANDYAAPRSPVAFPIDGVRARGGSEEAGEDVETTKIYNGERCRVIKTGGDFIDVEFPPDNDGSSSPPPPSQAASPRPLTRTSPKTMTQPRTPPVPRPRS